MVGAGAKVVGMATKERIHQLVDSLPDTPETEQQLDVIENQLEPNGNDAGDQLADEDSGPTFEDGSQNLRASSSCRVRMHGADPSAGDQRHHPPHEPRNRDRSRVYQ